ncbi:MAG: PTS transporter subunit IIC [Candidatus Njordarchaeales archaeon]
MQLDAIINAVQFILGLGPALMMPIILFILAIAFRQPVSKAARAAITVGVGFIGIFAVLGATLGVVGSAVNAMVSNWGLTLSGLDIGWPLTSAITWAFFVSALIIPIGFIVNIVLLIPGITNTFDADLWNYWHWAFTAVMVQMWTEPVLGTTGALYLAIIVAIIVEFLILKLADWTAPLGQIYFNVPGTSMPHTETVNWAPFALAIDKILRKVPALEKVKADPESLREKLGFFGEPMMLGFYVGILLGILALLPWYKIYELAMYIAALMLLEGRMIGILMEGLLPIADGISQVFARSERFKGRNIWIGIDAGPIGLSDPASIAVGMLLIPLYVASAMIPGAKILPLADLAILPIFAMWAAASSGGNLIRTFINAFILSLLGIYITNSFAEPLTAAALIVDPTLIPAGLALVSSVDAGGHVMPWFIIMIFLGILAPGVVSWVDVVIAILVAVLWFASWRFAKDMPEMVAEELKKKIEGEE